MEEYNEKPAKGKFDKLKKDAARLFLASLVATGIGEAQTREAEAQRELSPLERYGRIELYNANEQEGGTRGQSGVVYDPVNEQVLLCTIEHVAQGGPIWRDAFDIERSGGDDPIVCSSMGQEVVENKSGLPEISMEEINQGDIISMPNEERGTTDFVVTEVEEDKVWFVPENPEDWRPEGGDSGTLVGSIEGEDTYAIGVYAGQSIMPNRENPDEPIVTYFMVPFESED